jgi:hypothetical protein
VSAPGAGIGRLVARALGPREALRSEPDLEPAADDATLVALRQELAAELARVSREHRKA